MRQRITPDRPEIWGISAKRPEAGAVGLDVGSRAAAVGLAGLSQWPDRGRPSNIPQAVANAASAGCNGKNVPVPGAGAARLIHRRMHREPKECGATAAARPQTSGTGSGCCDPAPSQHDATLLVHCMHGRRQMTATRRPVMGSVVTIGSVRVIHPLSQRGSGQGINLACLDSLHLSSRRVGDLDLAPIS